MPSPLPSLSTLPSFLLFSLPLILLRTTTTTATPLPRPDIQSDLTAYPEFKPDYHPNITCGYNQNALDRLNNTNPNPDPSSYTFTRIHSFTPLPLLTHANPLTDPSIFYDLETQISTMTDGRPPTTPLEPRDKPYVIAAYGYAFIVKPVGDNKNLNLGNVAQALQEVEKTIKSDQQNGGELRGVRLEIRDPNGQGFVEGIVGFYDLEVLLAMQGCGTSVPWQGGGDGD